ncbi:LytR/AlgR family response regulator transcription factor [Marinoscillum sp.]|uniref:LytR/AlgR family response regulator transcription factor n=1 Tax=Marinoscillum sp. TaxID=2024838 RepID=UPI003BAB7FD9
MNCIIIDDEQTSRMILSQLCSQLDDLNVVGEFSNAIQAIKYLNQEEVDLIFLDIHMPDFSGFDFIQTLKSPPRIILTTSDSSLALDAFEYECIVDYVVKPVTLARFEKAVQKARAFVPAGSASSADQELRTKSGISDKFFYVNIDRTLIKIDTESVNVIEAKGDYIVIKTQTKEYRVHSTLKKIVDKLPTDQFLQVHRSYVINLMRIVDIEDNSILIEKDVIPISRSKRPELMRRLDLL